jgi:hypothetical protein
MTSQQSTPHWFAIPFLLLAFVLAASSASALPTMIRLGYNNCAGCHVSPQGGGLLTPYGKGVDTAQSLFREEVETAEQQLRLLYDVRAVMGATLLSSQQGSNPVAGSSLRFMLRNAVNMSSHTQFSYQAGLAAAMTGNTPTTQTTRSADFLISKAIFEYRPKEGLALQIGRDTLPDGIGLPDPRVFMQKQHDPFGTNFPLQAKAFVWNPKFELTPYVYGPGFDETRHVARQRGGGVVGGVDVWKQRAVIGMTARTAYSPSFDRKSVGAYARLGFHKWGILEEHDVTARVVNGPLPSPADYVTGYTQLFVAPVEWFVTSLIVDDVVASGSVGKHTYRFAPTAAMRLSNNVTVVVGTRDDVIPGLAPNSRTYSVSVALKSVQ